MNTKKKVLQGTSFEWRVNTPQLLKEIIEGYPNNQGVIFFQPINILKSILIQLGERASEINDPVLNAIMCRLAIYGESDPYSGDYNHDKLMEAMNHPEYVKWEKKRKATT
jgi:hypothetical protein